MKKHKEWRLPLAVFLIISIVLSGLFILVQRQLVWEKKERYQYLAANQANIMRDGINTAFARAYTLRILVQDNEGDSSFFEKEAPAIYTLIEEDSGVTLRNMALAPGGVVEKVYPLEGNEQLVGFNFMDESYPGNEEAIEAYQNNKLIVANPFTLIQGGVGMGGRLPVYIEKDGIEEFWGLVSITLDFDEVLRALKLESLSDVGINYRLWYLDDSGQSITMATSDIRPKNPQSYQFQLRNLTWNLDVEPANGWSNMQTVAAGILIVLLVALMVALLLYDKSRDKKINERLEFLANHDQLTKCYSRHYVNTQLINSRTGRWKDSNATYSIAVVDIDFFKNINDTCGHEFGDKVIVEVAKILKRYANIDEGDCVIRHGGDEFIVLYGNYTESKKRQFARQLEQIVEAVRALRFESAPGIRISVSIGGAVYTTKEESKYYDLMRRADRKLYEAKANGRNQCQV